MTIVAGPLTPGPAAKSADHATHGATLPWTSSSPRASAVNTSTSSASREPPEEPAVAAANAALAAGRIELSMAVGTESGVEGQFPAPLIESTPADRASLSKLKGSVMADPPDSRVNPVIAQLRRLTDDLAVIVEQTYPLPVDVASGRPRNSSHSRRVSPCRHRCASRGRPDVVRSAPRRPGSVRGAGMDADSRWVWCRGRRRRRATSASARRARASTLSRPGAPRAPRVR